MNSMFKASYTCRLELGR